MDMRNKMIGNNIKRARKYRNMTQQQLAETANLSVPHIAHLECGSTNLSINSLLALCNALSVTPNDILSGLFSLAGEDDRKMLYESATFMTKKDQDLILDIAELMTKYRKPDK